MEDWNVTIVLDTALQENDIKCTEKLELLSVFPDLEMREDVIIDRTLEKNVFSIKFLNLQQM